jgi:hypothetical protein
LTAYYGPEWESLAARMLIRLCPSFTGSTGPQAPDLSLHGNHGVLVGDRNKNWQASDGQTALVFNGTSEHAFSSSARPYGDLATDSLAFNFWLCNPTGTTGTLAGLASSTNSTPFVAFQNVGTSLRLVHRSQASVDSSTSGGTYRSSTWRMLTAVLQPNAISLFINGVFTATTVRAAQTTTLNQLTLGALRRAGALGSFAVCQIDDIIIFQGDLQAQEIALLYGQGRGGGLLREPPRRRSFFVPTAPTPLPVRRRSSRFLAFPG